MTLDQAIEIKQRHLPNWNNPKPSSETLADKLGIEALKRLKDARFDQRMPYTIPLPGETKE